MIHPDHPALRDVALLDAVRAEQRRRREQESAFTPPAPSRNPFRPATMTDIIGQAPAKALLGAALDAARREQRPLDHVLLVGPSGMGKTTFASALAHELGTTAYQLEAPVSHNTLLELRTTMRDGDVLFLDEIHQQGIMERRGRDSATQAEVLFSVMEDRTIPTETGVLPFPAICLFGATTDPGRLPEAFLNRFPLRPVLVPYAEDELILMSARNARALGRTIRRNAARQAAQASRGVPRELNNIVRAAAMFTAEPIDLPTVERALDLQGVERDGLTRPMVSMLRFLYEKGQRDVGGKVCYQASVNTIATGIGLSRDTKAVSLYVEPTLIERGLVQVAHGGRILTDAGIERAKELADA